MLTALDAIRERHSVRRFRPDPVPGEVVDLMLEAARLAPSGSNRQPWRFQLVTDQALKQKIFDEATFGARHILEAPLMIVCGSELLSYVKGNPVAPSTATLMTENDDWDSLKQFVADAHMNTAIAIEHMALTAAAVGVGTCWVQRIRPGQLARVLGWPRHLVVLCLLLAGYAAEPPTARPRLTLKEITIEGHGCTDPRE